MQPLLLWNLSACICSLRYPACNAHAPYCHLWLVPLYKSFPHYLINSMIFENKLLNTKWVFWILFNFYLKHISFYEEIREIWLKKYILVVMYHLAFSDFNDTWIFSTEFRKIIKYQILWKSVQWEPSCSMRTDGHTDRHDEAHSRFLKFCERA